MHRTKRFRCYSINIACPSCFRCERKYVRVYCVIECSLPHLWACVYIGVHTSIFIVSVRECAMHQTPASLSLSLSHPVLLCLYVSSVYVCIAWCRMYPQFLIPRAESPLTGPAHVRGRNILPTIPERRWNTWLHSNMKSNYKLFNNYVRLTLRIEWITSSKSALIINN